jgi:hypothetical protein
MEGLFFEDHFNILDHFLGIEVRAAEHGSIF